jgi:transcriptional regulator with XRE-family HTH domain
MDKNDISNKLGRRIVQLRESFGLRQIDLAHKSDLDDAFLRRIESGRVNPTIKTLERIANALNVEMKDLFDF